MAHAVGVHQAISLSLRIELSILDMAIDDIR